MPERGDWGRKADQLSLATRQRVRAQVIAEMRRYADTAEKNHPDVSPDWIDGGPSVATLRRWADKLAGWIDA